jgi:hypothetical protein
MTTTAPPPDGQPDEPTLTDELVAMGGDTTVTDSLVEPTGNGPQPDDPDEQPSQDPAALPEGTETGQGA